MELNSDLDVFLKPKSVAVIGATERPGSWGSFIMEGLLSRPYPGQIYPVNSHAGEVYGLPAFRDVRDITGRVDLAVLAIPRKSIEETFKACCEKKVRGVTIITAGYGEALEGGRNKELDLTRLARSSGMRILGPNVSGTFNLDADFNASALPANRLVPTPLAAVCQGGYAFYDLLSSAFSQGMGVGKFIHTGNECDLTVTDFLDLFGEDPDVKGILMYLETVRDGRRFIGVAHEVSRKKPIVVYKGGRTPGSSRAAMSHTGALSGSRKIYKGLLHQTGIIVSPSMELMIPIGHALIDRPPMRGRKIAVVTMGGSWGVALSDSLEEAGLDVVELSPALQKRLRSIGMPNRASTKNPVDIGASGRYYDVDTMLNVGREILLSGEVDAMVLHGVGSAGTLDENTPPKRRMFINTNNQIIQGFHAMERETKIPVLIGSHYSKWQSQEILNANEKGIRAYQSLYDLARVLVSMWEFWDMSQSRYS